MTKAALTALVGRPLRTALTMLAIVLGVAMVAAAFTVTDTMRKGADSLSTAAYDGTDAVVAGRTAFEVSTNDWAVTKPRIDAALLERVRAVPEVGVAVGDIVDLNTKVIATDGKPIGDGPYFGVGYDSSAEGAETVSPFQLTEGRWATGPDEVVLGAGTAEDAKAKVGDRVRIASDRGGEYTVTGLANFGDVRSLGTATIAVFDLESAQAALGREGQFDDLLLTAAPGVTPAAMREAVAAALPDRYVVETAAANDRYTLDGLNQFIDIIRIVLLVFGGVAILVGAFTIGNALAITVAQRSRELGLLRLVGASRRQVLGSVVLEALVLGVLSSIAGVIAGYFMAKGLTAVLAGFGLDLPEVGTVFAASTVVIAMVVGTVVTLLAGLVPAIRATRVAPVEVLRDAAVREPGIAGRAVRAVVSVVGRPSERLGGTAGALARRNAMRNPGRTLATALALTIGVALVTLVTVVAAGLKDSTRSSLERRVTADRVMVGEDGWSPIDASAARELAAVDGVRAVTTIVQDGALVLGDVEVVNRVDPATVSSLFRFDWEHGDDSVPGNLGSNGAIVDSGWATENGLRVGSTFEATSPKGSKLDLVVRGIEDSPIMDALGLGPVTIGKDAYDGAFVNTMSYLTLVDAGPEASAGLKQVMAAHPDAKLQSTSKWIDTRTEEVDSLTAIFGVLLALAVIVSLIGIVNTLALSTFERTREIGMLRAVGMTRLQLRRMVRHESVITALLGALVGMGVGLGLAAIVTTVFADAGLSFAVPVAALIAFTIVAIVAGVLAAIGPARRAARLDPLTALAYE